MTPLPDEHISRRRTGPPIMPEGFPRKTAFLGSAQEARRPANLVSIRNLVQSALGGTLLAREIAADIEQVALSQRLGPSRSARGPRHRTTGCGADTALRKAHGIFSDDLRQRTRGT
jgi:hypothetical protein